MTDKREKAISPVVLDINSRRFELGVHGFVQCVAEFVVSLAVLLSANWAVAQDAPIIRPQPNSAEQRFYWERANAQGVIPPGVRHRAMEQLRQIRTPADDRLQWIFIGPMPTVFAPGMPLQRDFAFNYNGAPTSGRVTALAADPRDANIVYLGAAEGGVWKTTDGGAHWQPIFDFEDSLAIGSIAIDPQDPNTIYVGTGDDQFNLFNLTGGFTLYGDGIYKSIDGGATWRHTQNVLATSPLQIATGFIEGGYHIVSLAVKPDEGRVVLAGVQASPLAEAVGVFDPGSGVFRSEDGGNRWHRVLAGQGPPKVLFDPTDGTIAYAMIPLLDDGGAGVFKSTDGGQTWAQSFSTLFVGGQMSTIAIAPNTPTTLYALLDLGGAGRASVMKTVDGGQSWASVADPAVLCGVLFLTACEGGRPVIAVHPGNPDLVVAAYQEFINRSTDGGVTWTTVNRDSLLPFLTQTHTDHHVLAFSADGSVLYNGNDGGAYRTTNITTRDPSAVVWSELNDTLGITQFYGGLSIDSDNLNVAFAGTQDNGLQKYSGSLAWTWLGEGDAFATSADFVNDRLYFQAFTGFKLPLILDSTDDGGSSLNSFTALINSTEPIYGDVSSLSPFALDPNDGTRLYMSGHHVWQSMDEGVTWTSISPSCISSALTSCFLESLAVAPSDSNTIYAAGLGFNGTVASTPQMVTRDALAGTNSHWSVLSSAALPPRVASSIAVHPTVPTTAYFAFSGFSFGSDSLGHVFKTADAGNTWTDISGQLPDTPVNAIVIDPDRPTTLYIGTDIGVFRTTDDGRNWHPLKGGMPNVTVTDLKFHRATRTLRAATHGRGVWDLTVPLD